MTSETSDTPPAAAPLTFKAVPLDALAGDDAFEPMEREGKLYVVRLRPKILVQTPPLALTSSLVDDDGEPLTFAHLAPAGQFAAFLRRAEAAVLDACLAHKHDWFRKDFEDDALRSGFKTFLRPNGTIKVKVPEDVAVFDVAKRPIPPGDAPAGSQVRCILELAKISFGKTEFGAAWKLVQVRSIAQPRCLIDDTADEASSDDDDFL